MLVAREHDPFVPQPLHKRSTKVPLKIYKLGPQISASLQCFYEQNRAAPRCERGEKKENEFRINKVHRDEEPKAELYESRAETIQQPPW